MTEKEKRQIQFGDITFAEFIDEKTPVFNKENEKVIPICLKPSERLIRVASISKDELDRDEDKTYGKKPKGSVWREYPVTYVDWMRFDWLFIWCDFNRNSTKFSNKMQGLDVYIIDLEKTNENLKDMIIHKEEEIESLMSQQEEREKKQQVIDEIRKGKREEKEGDEENDG